MNKKTRELLVNLAVAVLPVLFLYGFVEFVLFKPYLPSLPMRYHQRLMEPYQMLTQRSKKGTMPHDYTLIVGDSYASGWGDWLRSVDIGKNEPYASHDLIYQATGIDTVQGGFAGGSITETLVRKPVNRYRFLRKTLFYKIEDPKRILWYFYEGNDLVDDHQRLSSPYKGKIDVSRIYDKEYFRQFLDTEVLKSDALYYDVRRFKWHYNCVSFHMLYEIAVRLFEKFKPSQAAPPAAEPGTNCFLSEGKEICIPRSDVLCPSIFLTPDEQKLSLYIAGESLDYLRSFFPKAEITIVYIPSPITAYPITSEKVHVQKQNDENPFITETKRVFEKSDEHFAEIRKLGQARGIRTLDMRPYLRDAAAKEGLLHGPIDFYHFNRRGYEVLAAAIVKEMGWIKEAA